MKAAILGIGLGVALLGGTAPAQAGDDHYHGHNRGYNGGYYSGYCGYSRAPSFGFSATYAPGYGLGVGVGSYYGVPAYRPVPSYGGYGPYYRPYGYGHHHHHHHHHGHW